jgi:hypothetical protein
MGAVGVEEMKGKWYAIADAIFTVVIFLILYAFVLVMLFFLFMVMLLLI